MSEQVLLTYLINVPGHWDVKFAITNILSQTIADQLEIIVCIQPSVLTGTLRDEIAAMTGPVRMYVPDEDVGPAELLREGIGRARGEYVTWSVAHQFSDPRRLEWMMAAMAALPRPGVVSCGLRKHNQVPDPRATTAPVPGIAQDPGGILRSLLDGSRNAVGMLVHTSCLHEAGGFDPSYKKAYELDLAVRLALRFPFGHVQETCLRSMLDPGGAAWNSEYERICIRLLETECQSPHALAGLAGAIRSSSKAALSVHLCRQLEPVVSESDLAILVPNKPGATPSDLLSALGVPFATFLELKSETASTVEALLRKAAKQNRATWLMVVDALAAPPKELLMLQLLHAIDRGLDVCFPVFDNAAFHRPGTTSLIPGTLFRTSVLQRLDWSVVQTEHAFWMAVKNARIGGIPNASDGPRRSTARHRAPRVAIAAALVDERWYKDTYTGVPSVADSSQHFLTSGWRERHNPNSWFDTAFYFEIFPQLTGPGINPVEYLFSIPEVPGSLVSRPGFDLRQHLLCCLNGKAPTCEALLAVLLPGVQKLSSRLNASDTDTLVCHIEAVAPGLATLLKSLPAELEIYQSVNRMIDPEWYRERYHDIRTREIDPIDHYIRFGGREGRDPNPWFDSAWYIAQAPEAAQSYGSPLEHYVREGAGTGKTPHPGFHSQWYARRYLPPGTRSGPHILLHFLTEGAKNGNVPHPRLDRSPVHQELALLAESERPVRLRQLYAKLPDERTTLANLIDREWYRSVTTQPAGIDIDPVAHYLHHSKWEYADPNPWFDSRWYLDQNPSARDSGLAPLVHFVRIGAYEGRRPSAGFDPVWYGERYLGALTPTADALHHFLASGIWNGAIPERCLDRPEVLDGIAVTPAHERPSLLRRLSESAREHESLAAALIDEKWYRSRYQMNGASALIDYREKGWHTGRNPNRWFDTTWYLQRNRDVRALKICPLDHFILTGAAEGRDPHPLFRTAWYARFYLGSANRRVEALLHFMTIGFDNGNVPDPRLATPNLQKHLQAVGASSRAELIGRLLEGLSRAQIGPVRWSLTDADLWPVLLTRDSPEFAVGVLLLVDPGSPEGIAAAQAAARSLPPEEAPLFGLVEDENSLVIADKLSEGALSLVISLPGDRTGLQTLLRAIPCRRAAVLTHDLANSAVARAVRNAGVPVYSRQMEQPFTPA